MPFAHRVSTVNSYHPVERPRIGEECPAGINILERLQDPDLGSPESIRQSFLPSRRTSMVRVMF